MQMNSELTAAERAVYAVFLVVLIGCFSPVKPLAYVLPLAATGWLALRAPGVVSGNRVAILVLVLTSLGVVYSLLASEFFLANYIVAIITYSAVIPLLVIPSRNLASKALLRQMLQAAAVMVSVQGVIGIMQAIYGVTQTGGLGGDNGDFVEGTIHPALAAERTFSNPMFATNMVLLLVALFAIPEMLTGRRRSGAMLGASALVLASVVHVLVFFVVAAFAALVLVPKAMSEKRKASPRGKIVGLVAAVCVLAVVALPGNTSNIRRFAEEAIDLDALEVPRAILLYRVFTELPDDAPLQPYIGLGPGHFSSRASLMTSGFYLGGPDAAKGVPLAPMQATRLTVDYCISLFMVFADADADSKQIGSSQQPFFSILAIYTEVGGIGLAFVLGTIGSLLAFARKRATVSPEHYTLALVGVVGVTFISLLGVQQLYWEVPQAVLPGVLILKTIFGLLERDQLP